MSKKPPSSLATQFWSDLKYKGLEGFYIISLFVGVPKDVS